ncbi:MAG: carbamate kinase [Candidatus Cloacimonetes bacterium]|nr:carbamate kinase [Candidatus Cloacimonadota bacterium]MBS3767432.1 carbamate kinase [Candidatus Cloacimonadota bacterium]
MKKNKDKRPLVVIALGGNAIKQADEEGTVEEQFANVTETCKQLVEMNHLGYKLIITHGNGPQAGNLLIQQEEGKDRVPPQPLDVVGAMTQGQIGYMFQNSLRDLFLEEERSIPIATVLTQVLVDPNDPDFADPSKPVGPFYTKETALQYKEDKGYQVKKVKPNGEKNWRRVVPSPEPKEIIEADCISSLIDARAIVIASGGGGIPVKEMPNGTYKGLEAVIDKDKAGNVLAQATNADIFLILTDVSNAYINFGKDDQKPLEKITVTESEKYYEEGQFLKGSMGPKITAAIRFVKSGGEKAIITSLDHAVEALQEKTGTIITKE